MKSAWSGRLEAGQVAENDTLGMKNWSLGNSESCVHVKVIVYYEAIIMGVVKEERSLCSMKVIGSNGVLH